MTIIAIMLAGIFLGKGVDYVTTPQPVSVLTTEECSVVDGKEECRLTKVEKIYE